MKKNLVAGQTIIEVLIALSTAVVIITASTVAVTTAVNNASYTQTQNSATRYAQEGLEFVRFLRGSNYTEFNALENGTVYCLDYKKTVLTKAPVSSCSMGPCDNSVYKFSRSVVIEKRSNYCSPTTSDILTPTPDNTTSKITVSVSWTDGKCPSSCPCHQSQLISCVSDYTVVAPPAEPTPTEIPTP